RHDVSQSRREFLGRSMRESRENDLLQLSRLNRDGFRNQRMPVAMKINPPRGDRVEQTPAVTRVKVRALAARDLERFRFDSFLRVWMPYLHANTRESKCFWNTAISVLRSIVSSHGIEPTIATFPYRSIARRFSTFSWPTITTPRNGTCALRI